jgi:hypothetical protein
MKPVSPARARAGEEADGAGDKVALAAVGERLRAERDGAMRGAHHHGVPISAVARMMKMTVQRVSRIIDS